MNRSTFWLLCLLGFAILNQGLSRPQDDYQLDGEGDDYPDGDEEDDDSPAGPPPRITTSDSTQVVDVGGVVFLPCDVEGNPSAFTRIWRKDQKGLFVGSIAQTVDPRITNLINGSLEIRQVQPSDAGTYSCLISAGKGEEVHHTLQINSPAQIVSIKPSEKSVIRRNSTLTLECIAHGYPTPSIKWFRNGHVLEDQDPSIHGARYTISSASLEDSGVYKCTATNGQQQPDEKTVEIEVHYPPQIKIAKAIVPTGEGYESELKCSVSGMKKPELKWYRNEDQKPIMPSERIKIEKKGHDHILRILKTQQSDFGDYVCEAKNSEGQEQAVITLTGKPSRPEADTFVTEGENKNPLLSFRVESFAPIEDYELLYKREEKDEWISVKPTVTSPMEGRFYIVKHVLQDLEPGVYIAQLKARNAYGWSEMSSKVTFPQEHEGDFSETGLLAAIESGASSELRISLALAMSLLVAHFYC